MSSVEGQQVTDAVAKMEGISYKLLELLKNDEQKQLLVDLVKGATNAVKLAIVFGEAIERRKTAKDTNENNLTVL